MSKPDLRFEHFSERCFERGISQNLARELYDGLAWARQNKRDDLALKVLVVKGASFFRFRCPDGIFYAVFPGDSYHPVTVYDQKMFSETRSRHKSLMKSFRGRRKFIGGVAEKGSREEVCRD